MKTKLSIYIPIHNHPSLLHYVLDSCIEIANEVVIVDGAYENMQSWFDLIGADPAKSDKETLDIIDSYKDKLNIIYYSGIWKNEPEKHTFGFNKCTNNIILTIDSDEPFILYPEEVNKFAESKIFAGTLTEKAPVTGNLSIDFPGTKRKIFNRSIPNDLPHYDYLPLLRDYQVSIPWETVYKGIIGHICHLCSMRPPSEQYNRTIMYHGIASRSKEGSGGLFGTKCISAIDSDTHKQCYIWNHLLHNTFIDLNVVKSKDYPLANIAKEAYNKLTDFYNTYTNILDIKDPNGIPIECNYPTRLIAPNIEKYNTIKIGLSDPVNKIPVISTQYRIFKDNKIASLTIDSNSIYNIDNIIIAKFDPFNITEGIIQSYLYIVLSIGKEFTFIKNVEFTNE